MKRANVAKSIESGFTLFELLAVVAIVLVLLVLLFTGLGAAQESASSVKCMANLRTLGSGFASYAAENNNQFPNYAQGAKWPERIAQYVPKAAFFCPKENKKDILQKIKTEKGWADNQILVSYGYNYRYLAPDFGSTWSVPRAYEPITYSRISRLSQVILLADAGRLSADKKSSWGFYVMEPPNLEYSMPVPRHRDQANILWTDGSVGQAKCILEKKDAYKYLTERNWDFRLQ